MSDLLSANHLVEVEMEGEDKGEFTLPNAVERVRRRAYWQAKLVEVDEHEQELLAPLIAEMERIKTWAQEQRELPQSRIAFYDGWFRAYYIANPPPKHGGNEVKHIKLPGGRIEANDPSPKWSWPSDTARLTTILQSVAPELVKTETVHSFAKNDLKALAKGDDSRVRVEDGKVYGVTQDGERLELPDVTVETVPTVYTFKPA